MNSRSKDFPRRDFLTKALAVPAAVLIAIPLATDDAEAQAPGKGKGGKGGKGPGGPKGAGGKGQGGGKGPGGPKGAGGKGQGGAKGPGGGKGKGGKGKGKIGLDDPQEEE